MKFRGNSFAAGLSALLIVFTPAIASAARTYLLVGVNHVFVIGDDPNLYQDERKEIEETYADCVASDFATSESRIANGAAPAQENRSRNADLEKLAEDRDECLDELYETRDDLRDSYPDFKLIDCDGPYQVLAVEYHADRENESAPSGHVEGRDIVYQAPQVTIDAVTVVKPWPGYAAVDDPYGGWVYGQRYATTEFFDHWRKWRVRHRGKWSLVAFSGHGGLIPFERGRFVGRPEDYVVERGYAHARGRLHKTGVRRHKHATL
jgi:hypothetical protein